MASNYEIDFKDTNIVSKSNTLIEANYRLSLVEQKIMLCLASNIEPADRDFKTYTFPIKQFHELLGLGGSTKYTELSKMTKDLIKKVIEIKLGDDLIQVSWLSSAIYNKNRGTIDIRFDPLLKPFLLELSSKFTSYRLANVIKLRSTYAIRIYELLKQYENLKERTIPMDDLRYYLDARDVYPSYANFKQRILVPSQKELIKKTDISFDFVEIKKGRKVDKIKFIIKGSKNKADDIEVFQEKLHSFQKPNSFEEKIKRFEERSKEKVYPKVLERWKQHEDMVIEIIDSLRFRTDVESPIGFVEWTLNKRLQELENKTIQDSSGNELNKIDEVVTTVIKKYAGQTGAIATFLVKDTAIELLLESFTEEEAEEIWKEQEEFVMDTIYTQMARNRSKKKRY
ncbi:replication initiation protein [Bacillus luti]